MSQTVGIENLPPPPNLCIDRSPHNFVFLRQETEEISWHNFETRDVFFCSKCLTTKKVRYDKPAESDYPFDECECGDYRHQHEDGTGQCRVCLACNPPFIEKCRQFRLARRDRRLEEPQV